MDLKFPSEISGARPASMTAGDLLSRLRAAGTIEAEVVGLLKDNQLLLNSRLGQILTRNSLQYKVGDRINLRLDESTGQAVLKASPAPLKPYRLDSRANAELAQALPASRPTLARVARVVAQGAEVRLAEQIVKLPRELDLPKNQLLSLRRIDSQRAIEIRPLADKAIYKAILQQLLPRQAQTRLPALVRLLDFANTISRPGGNLPPSARAANGSTPTRAQATPTRALESAAPRQSAQSSPGPAARPVGVATSKAIADMLGSAAGRPGRQDPAAPGPAGAQPGLGLRPGPDSPASTTRPAGPGFGGADAESSSVRQPRAEVRQTANIDVGGNRVAARAAPVVESGFAPSPAGKKNVAGRSAPANDTPSQAQSPAKPAQAARQPPAASDVSSRQQAAMQTNAVPAAGSNVSAPWPASGFSAAASPASLQPLLQLVTALADIDATQVRKWFEFSRLVRSPSSSAQAPAGSDLFRLLQPLGESETLAKVLSQTISQRPAGANEAEAAAQKPTLNEVLPQQVREGTRLVEQSLSQNLLQRATLGLQQETQQPLSLSLALPFVDQQQLRPIHIDLEQRKQARDEADRSWEIRLSFELAGLGCIACHLLLQGLAVAASFYSEDENTRARIEAELPQLRQQLTRAGFDPGEFHSFPGRPEPGRQPAAADFAEALIDLEA